MSLDPSRWQQIAAIYESVADQDAVERKAFLSRACSGDEALRRHVESLLGQDGAAVVLDRSVWAAAASLFDDESTLGAGTALGPYRIERPLGAGGMGAVFRAIDTRLNRPVAIKVLPTGVALDPEMRTRFALEARAIAALTHPHICTLYDVGRQDDIDFLVMECLEGDTLAARLAAGRLPVEQALAYAIEIASALDHSHRQEVLHRDLKPGNIMLTAGGAKLLDFGLAKVLAVASRSARDRDVSSNDTARAGGASDTDDERSADDQEQLTRHGTLIGTIRYMAPEQLDGQDADARSELFSFGVVLFEMLTGARAFDGDGAAGLRAAILDDEPPPVSRLEPLVPPTLDEIVRRCLDKNPGQRWQRAGDVLRALRQASEAFTTTHTRAAQSGYTIGRASRWAAGFLAVTLTAATAWVMAGGLQHWRTTTAAGRIRSLAVLPLENLSDAEDQEHFADDMTEQLIADLATVDGLRVISRTSVMHYKAVRKPVPVIARELRVDAIIDGTVVQAGGRLRITTRLVSGATGDVLWAQAFERDLKDMLSLQSDVASSITNTMDRTMERPQVTRPKRVRAVDPAVHRQVLLARHHAAKGTEEGLRTAVEFFTRAIAADPGHAAAHAGLAEAYTELSGFYVDPRQAMPKAKHAAETAIHLDDALAEAHAALGYVQLVYEWDGPAAATALRRALYLNPTLATARLNYAAYLSTQARHEDAVREVRRAVDLDPVSVRTHAFGAMLLLFTRRADQSLELARRGLELEPKSGFILAVQGVAYAEQKRYDEAVDNLRRAAELDNSLTILALQAHVLAVAGRREQAIEVLRTVEEAAKHRYFCPYQIGTVSVSLGRFDTATALFRKGTSERADCMAWLGVEPSDRCLSIGCALSRARARDRARSRRAIESGLNSAFPAPPQFSRLSRCSFGPRFPLVRMNGVI